MIINDCEIWFTKLGRPNAAFNKKNPTWEAQIRTTSKEVKKQWEAADLGVKAIVPDEGETYFRVNLRKKSIKEDGTPASPVNVIDGDMKPVDPNTIGNGSIGNVRIFQYEYPKEGGGVGKASVLMGIQLTKHILYTPKPRDDDFAPTTTEVVPEENAESENKSKSPSPKVGVDKHDDEAF